MGRSMCRKAAIKFFVLIFFFFPFPIFGAQLGPTISYQIGNNQNAGRPVGGKSAGQNGQQNGQSAGVNSEGQSQIAGGANSASTTISPSSIAVADNATVNCDGPPRRCDLNGRRDFNPILSGGIPGQPGIKARLNPSAFQYLSQQFAGVLNYRIKRFPLPQISQCLPQVQGCVRIPNLHVTNYRCTNNVHLHPAPPNRLILDTDGMDLSVEGNLGGQVTIMVPLALYGRIHADAYRVHIRVGVVLVSNGSWPALQMASCSASVGHLQMDIQNGGLLGDIARQQLQAKLTRIVRQQFSRQICSRVPQLLNQEINSKIPTIIPEKMNLNTLVGMATGFSCISKLIGMGDESEDMEETESTTALARKQRAILAPNVAMMGNISISMKMRREIAPIGVGPQLKDNEVKIRRQTTNGKEGEGEDEWITSETEGTTEASNGADKTSTTMETATGGGGTTDASENTDAEAAAADADAAAAGESGGGGASSFLPILTSLIDLTKFENIYLNLQFLNSVADSSSYTAGIRGGFSVCSWGCTPFGPFPTQIPPCGNNCRMADVLISDFTLNSLLYHLNRVGFFVFNITPDTPEIGKLMTLNCDQSASTDEEESTASSVFFLEDHGVELENGTKTKGRDDKMKAKRGRKRARRQDDGGSCMNVDSIAELFCIGSLLPAAKSEDEDKGGKEKVDLKIRTDRAPDVIIRPNGTIALEFSAVLEFFAHSTGALITTFHVDLVLNANVQVEGDDHVKATLEIARLNVRDVGGKSGMDQDGLDTIINLISEKMLECANSLVEKGCKIEIPEGFGGLPLNLSNLKIGFVDHALHLQANFKISEDSDVLGGSEPCTTMRTVRRQTMKRKMN